MFFHKDDTAQTTTAITMSYFKLAKLKLNYIDQNQTTQNVMTDLGSRLFLSS